MPNKEKALREHLLNMDYAPLEDEVLDLKFTLYTKELCTELDKLQTTARVATLLNTANHR